MTALLATAVPAPTATATTTSVRVAVPDLAGSLYPQQAQGRAARFAVSSASLTPFYASQLPANEASPPSCDWPAALCLAVVWTSQYQYDPFVLVAFESKNTVRSRTFDGVANTTTLLPIIEGNQGENATNETQKRTLWQFHVLQDAMTGYANETIDLLFRVRQQSQLRGARDQLLVHVVATRADSTTNSAAVETYVVYGNQRVRHSIVHASASQIWLDVNISRDASRADVLLQDAYPLVPVIRDSSNAAFGWRMMDTECRRCTARFLECDSPSGLESGACTFEMSAAEVPVCLRTTQGLSTEWYRNQLTSGTIGQAYSLTVPIWECLKGIFERESIDFKVPDNQSLSWNVTSALSCLAARQCPFGPLDGVLPNTTLATAMLQLATPVPFTYHLEWPEAQALSGIFDVTFGGGSNFDLTFAATADEISDISVTADVERVLLAVFSGLDYVRVNATLSQVTGSMVLNIEVWNLPHWYFDMNFVATSPDSSYMIQPMNPNGATLLRVAALNKAQLVFESECDQCTSELSACREDDTCRLIVLPCVEREIATIDVFSNATVDPEYGTHVVNMLPALASKCFAGVSVASWNPIRRMLVCLSRHTCRLDATNGTNTDESTFFRLVNGSQLIAAPLDVAQDGSTVVQLAISYNQATYPFHSAVEKLSMFVRLFVLGNAADVFVQVQEYALNPTWIQLRLTYANTLLPENPSFSGSAQVIVLEDSIPKGFVEFPDIDAFSVEGVRAAISSFSNTAANPDDLAAAMNYTWSLAPECLACSASLYGCSVAEVEQKTCVFDNAPSHLAQCIRQAFSREDLISLLNTSASQDSTSPSRVVTTDVTRCIQTATVLAGGTLSDRTWTTWALSCFAETRCPFGPVDLVQSERMLQLAPSRFVQSLRIPTNTFRLDLIMTMSQFEIARVTITETDYVPGVLSGVLAPVGIAVQAQANYVDSEWNLMITYGNVVASDFEVQIATSSVPSPHYIDQAVLRPATRLLVGPRLNYRVYLGSDHTTPPTPAPSEDPSSDLLQFSDECYQCDYIHLAACARSQFCRSTFAPCVQYQLAQSTFENLAQSMPDGSTSADLASILRMCNSVFFDRSEPIQNWLGCYAAARCPITRQEQGRSEDTYLQFVPASVNISTAIDDLWTTAYGGLTIAVSTPGASLFGQTFGVDSKQALEVACEHAAQGMSHVTVTMSPLGPSQGTSVNVVYDDPFFGDLVQPIQDNQVVTNVVSAPARLLVRSTSTSFPSLAWSSLVDKLSNMPSPPSGTPQWCSACAATYLSTCRDLPSCKSYLLECLTNSFESDGASVSSWNSDRNVYQVLAGCARKLAVSEWWPVQKYLVCMRDLQCPVDFDSGASFIRLRSGHVRMFVNSITQPTDYSLVVSFEGMTQSPTTVLDLNTTLQSMVGNVGGVVEMRVTAEANTALKQVDFYFRDYVGNLPQIEYGDSSSVETWLPSVVFYSRDYVGTSLLTSDLSNYMVIPQCSGICYVHLQKCVRGDSYESVLCRYQALPCVASVITNEIPNMGVGASTSVDLSNAIRTCFSSSYAHIQPIAQYLGCLVRTGCTLNEPRSTYAKTELKLQPGEQMLSVFGSKMVTMYSPFGVGDSSPQTFSAENPDYFMWRVRNSVLHSLADVYIGVEMLADNSQGLTITYDNYLGDVPVLSGPDVSVLRNAAPSIAIVSTDRIDASQWGRLSGALAAFTVDKSQGCASCTLDYLMSCSVCMMMVIPSLLIMLQDAMASPSSTYNLTDIFYTCVDTMPLAEWVPVARMLNCMMVNGCPTSNDPGSLQPPNAQTTFLMVSPAKTTLYMPKTMPQSAAFAVGRAPNHSMNAPTDTDYTTQLYADPENQYATFKQAYKSLLDTVGGTSPTITITERQLEPTSPVLALEIEIQDYFGWLPRFQSWMNEPNGPTDFPAESALPTILAQTYDNVTGASLAGLVSLLENVATPTPPPKVPTGACADQCAQKFYGCPLEDIASGQCTYKASNGFFASCLRKHVPPSVFWGISRVLETTYIVNAALTKCFALAQEQDAVTGGASFRTDLWNLANDHLTCYELYTCPFGPLLESVASNNMVVLQSTPGTRTFLVTGGTFTAVFRSTFGFRVTDSMQFSESISDEDLTLLVGDILPKGVVTVTKTDMSGWYSISVSYSSIFFPDFGLTLDAGATNVLDQTGNVTTFAALRTVPLDNTYLDNASTG